MDSRPSGITLVALWCFLGGLITATSGATLAFFFSFIARLFGIVSQIAGGTGTDPVQIVYMGLGVVLLLTGVGLLAVGWGLIEGRAWARTWGLAGLGIAGFGKLALASLPVMLGGGLGIAVVLPFIIPSLIDLMCAGYLMTSQEAKSWCGDNGEGWEGQQGSGGETRPYTPIDTEKPKVRPTIPAGQEPKTTAWLVTREGGRAGRRLDLRAGRNQIGRGSNSSIRLDDPTVSSEHAIIDFDQGHFYLRNVSRFDTVINGQRVTQDRQLLYDGDEIKMGNAVVVFVQVK